MPSTYSNVHSPCESLNSMAQLVPSRAAFNSSAPTMKQQQQQQPLLNSSSLSGDGLMLPDFACSPPSSAASPYIPYGLQTNEGQTVPSSPTFSTWNSYSPPSYFSDYSSHHSPSSTSSTVANIKSESVVCDNGNNFQSASLGCDSSLEELLDDYTFDYLYDSSASFVVKEENLTKPKVEVHVEENKSEQQQGNNALLRQCLRPAVNDYEQQRHLQFLNQVGTAAIAAAHNQQQSTQLLAPNMMKTEETSWINNNNSSANSAVLSGSGSGIAQQGGYASVHRLVMELGMEEVRSTCEYLGISPNPSQWSVENVRCWLQYTSRQCDLKSIQLERFHVEGCVLASMTEKEFSTRAPQGGEILYAKLFIWRSAWNQRAAMATSSSSPSNMNKTLPLQTPAVPTIQIDEPCSDMSDTLSCWINSTQDNLQPHQPQQQQSSSSYMLSVNHHLLAVPSPMSTSSQRSSLSPYSDHTHSCSEGDFASELEEMGEEEDDLMMMMNDDERAGSSASSRNGSRLPMAGAAGVGVGVGASPSPNGSHIHLWQFLKELLSQPAQHGSAIRWLDRQRGVFKIEDSVRVAKLWGKRKNRPAMNYDKLSRSIRQYYRKGIMKKTERSQRLVYQFCHPYAL